MVWPYIFGSFVIGDRCEAYKENAIEKEVTKRDPEGGCFLTLCVDQ